MVGLVSVVVVLLYLGRILGWAWGSKPIELGDVVFLVPILIVPFGLRRRVRVGLRQPVNAAEVDPIDEPIPSSQQGQDGLSSDEEDALRRHKEWAAADYHWWKR